MIFFLKSRKPPDRNTAAPTPTGVTASPPGTPPATPPLKIWSNPADELNYVWIPAGTFMMGCSAQDSECKDNEKPTHQVNMEKGFWLGQTEVTVTAYRRFAAKSARHSPAGEGTLPVSGVSWADAKEYCAAMGVRLPTEAEWEYAARAGNSQPYYGVISDIAWYADNSGDAPHTVGTKQPNAFGLYDMLGNVWSAVTVTGCHGGKPRSSMAVAASINATGRSTTITGDANAERTRDRTSLRRERRSRLQRIAC